MWGRGLEVKGEEGVQGGEAGRLRVVRRWSETRWRVGYRRRGEQGRGGASGLEAAAAVCSEGKESGPRAGVSRVSRVSRRMVGTPRVKVGMEGSGEDAEGEGEDGAWG